ncbi:MAG: PhzF family phenazine biosynthesis protein [Acidimicrobiia bacterium]|nr:PhzF family phenazine biosynthesis protein [Acidimicrobiia bacterium]
MTDVRVLRVFTRGSEGGNHLGVVEDAIHLDAAAMQSLASFLGYSETIFFDDTHVRIFTPTAEMPFAGHPIVGAAWTLGEGRDGASGTLTIEIGEVSYSIVDGVPWVTLRQPGSVTEITSDRATPLDLPAPERTWLVELPLPYLVMEYANVDDVASAKPDMAAMAALDPQVYIFAEGFDSVRARFFAPALGVDEDPATGSAAVALAAVRRASGLAEGQYLIHQGAEIGWPCAINLHWSGDEVSIGGTVVEEPGRRGIEIAPTRSGRFERLWHRWRARRASNR